MATDNTSQVFQIDEHEIECQHIREYPRAISGRQETVLHLSIKQYTPLDNLDPNDGDVTIISAHANGFPKELLEPLWEAIYHNLKCHGHKIRGIWIPDIAHQGRSGIINEKLLGNDPSGFDHSRDLLHMINQFRGSMIRPIVGVGHSMGGCHLVQLSLLHPRLLTSLVLLDPVIQPAVLFRGPSPALFSTFRRDIWPSRKVAEESFEAHQMYRNWHPEVLRRWKIYGLRDIPTRVYPDNHPGAAIPQKSTAVTLVTSKHQEVFTYLRPNPAAPDYVRNQTPDLDIVYFPIHDNSVRNPPFYRPEQVTTFRNLPLLRPSVLYIFGGKSAVSSSEVQDAKLAVTGIGVGGSGGLVAGKVSKVVFPHAGHLFPFELVQETAEECSSWLHKEIKNVTDEDARFYEEWGKVPSKEKVVVSKQWLDYMTMEKGALAKL